MKKGKKATNQLKRVEVCLDFTQEQYNICIDNQSKNQSKSRTLNSSKVDGDSEARKNTRKNRLLTNGSRVTDQNNEKGFIRLRSKRKNMKTKTQNIESYINTIIHTQQNQNKQENHNSINKELQKLGKIFNNSTNLYNNMNKSIRKQNQPYSKPLNKQMNFFMKSQFLPNSKKQIQNEQKTHKVQQNRRRLSQTKHLKDFFESKSTKLGKSCSLNKTLKSNNQNKKLADRLKNIKQYTFVEQHLSDLQLEGLFNQLQISDIPQVRWPLIIIDKVYQIIRRKQNNNYTHEIMRKF